MIRTSNIQAHPFDVVATHLFVYFAVVNLVTVPVADSLTVLWLLYAAVVHAGPLQAALLRTFRSEKDPMQWGAEQIYGDGNLIGATGRLVQNAESVLKWLRQTFCGQYHHLNVHKSIVLPMGNSCLFMATGGQHYTTCRGLVELYDASRRLCDQRRMDEYNSIQSVIFRLSDSWDGAFGLGFRWKHLRV